MKPLAFGRLQEGKCETTPRQHTTGKEIEGPTISGQVSTQTRKGREMKEKAAMKSQLTSLLIFTASLAILSSCQQGPFANSRLLRADQCNNNLECCALAYSICNYSLNQFDPQCGKYPDYHNWAWNQRYYECIYDYGIRSTETLRTCLNGRGCTDRNDQFQCQIEATKANQACYQQSKSIETERECEEAILWKSCGKELPKAKPPESSPAPTQTRP